MTTRSAGRAPAGRTARLGKASSLAGPDRPAGGGAGDEDRTLARLKRALRKAERRAGDGGSVGGTGATILKLLPPPLARLVDKGRIGTEEIRAADDITIAFHAQAGALFVSHPRM